MKLALTLTIAAVVLGVTLTAPAAASPVCVPADQEIACTGDGRDLRDEYALCPGRYVDAFVVTPAGWQYVQACIEERGRVTVMLAGATGHERIVLP